MAKILLVEDNEMNRDSLSRLLARRAHVTAARARHGGHARWDMAEGSGSVARPRLLRPGSAAAARDGSCRGEAARPAGRSVKAALTGPVRVGLRAGRATHRTALSGRNRPRDLRLLVLTGPGRTWNTQARPAVSESGRGRLASQSPCP